MGGKNMFLFNPVFWASIVVFGLLVFIHELGHFAVAKWAKIKVHEFSLGFGPRIFGFTKGDMSYNLRVVPLGGFVRMAGMNPEEEDYETEENGFNKKNVWKRIAVVFAGPFMNFVLAIFLLVIIYLFQGIPAPTTQVDSLVADGAAEEAGLLPGDTIVEIDGIAMENWQDIKKEIDTNPNQEISFLVDRNGEMVDLAIIPTLAEDGTGKIGVYPATIFEPVGILESLKLGTQYTVQVSALIINVIGDMITGNEDPELGGPVRIVSEIGKAVDTGIFSLIALAALLSINLGLFNLFPIPALDGSRILFLLWEAIRRKPIAPQKENFVHMIGFALLLLLFVVVTYNDVVSLL